MIKKNWVWNFKRKLHQNDPKYFRHASLLFNNFSIYYNVCIFSIILNEEKHVTETDKNKVFPVWILLWKDSFVYSSKPDSATNIVKKIDRNILKNNIYYTHPSHESLAPSQKVRGFKGFYYWSPYS